MKAFINTIVLAVMFSMGHSLAWSQTANDKVFNFVPQIGMNYTSDLSEMTNFKGGFSLGADLRLGKTLFFQPGVQYNYIAFQAQVDTAAGSVKPTGLVKGHYLSVPLLLGYKLVETKVFNFRVQGGVNTSLFISGQVDIDNVEEEFKKNVNSIRLGFGFDILKITFDMNADIGLNQSLKLPEEINTFRLTGTIGYLIR